MAIHSHHANATRSIRCTSLPASGFGNVAIDVPWWAGNNETVAGGRSLGERDRPAAAVQAAGHGSQADFGQSRPAKDSNVHTRFHGPRMELGIMLAELEAVTGETAPSISGTPWLTLRKNWVISLLGIIGVVGLVASFVEPWRTDVLLRACLVVSSLLCVVPIVALVSKSIALAARINRAGAELLATKR